MDQSGVSWEVRSPVRRLPYQSGCEGLGQHGVLGMERVDWMKEWGSAILRNWGSVCQR